ncbi:MAG: hypothetical protein AAF414_16490 [Pseudomonadota bacterium]
MATVVNSDASFVLVLKWSSEGDELLYFVQEGIMIRFPDPDID